MGLGLVDVGGRSVVLSSRVLPRFQSLPARMLPFNIPFGSRILGRKEGPTEDDSPRHDQPRSTVFADTTAPSLKGCFVRVVFEMTTTHTQPPIPSTLAVLSVVCARSRRPDLGHLACP